MPFSNFQGYNTQMNIMNYKYNYQTIDMRHWKLIGKRLKCSRGNNDFDLSDVILLTVMHDQISTKDTKSVVFGFVMQDIAVRNSFSGILFHGVFEQY